MTELYDHQRKAIDFAIARKGRAGLFMEPRLGKSRAALVITERLICRRVLIVCPLSVIGVWERECRIIDYPLPVFDLTVLNGTNLRAEALRSIKDGVVLLNYESYWRQPLRDAILRWSPDALIVDEAHRLRSRTTRQSRFAHQLAQRPHVRVSLPLTGTPIANGLQDLWSVYRLIDPSLFGSWADFAGEYLTYGGYQNHQIVGVRNEDKAKRIVSATSFQCTRAEVFDLPQEQTIHVPVRLSSATSTVYREMKRQALVEIEGSTSIAQTALVMLLRLHQITGGFLKEVNDGSLIDLSYEKAETTAEIANELVAGGEQVVVFTQFLKDLDHCIERLQKDGLRVARIDGAVSGADRTRVIEEFRQRKYDVLCAQIRTASLGIDLSTASSVIFYSTGYSLDDFIQARDRIAGANQKSKSLGYYYLQAVLDNGKPTVDSKIYEALLSKTSVAAKVLELGYGGLFSD